MLGCWNKKSLAPQYHLPELRGRQRRKGAKNKRTNAGIGNTDIRDQKSDIGSQKSEDVKRQRTAAYTLTSYGAKEDAPVK